MFERTDAEVIYAFHEEILKLHEQNIIYKYKLEKIDHMIEKLKKEINKEVKRTSEQGLTTYRGSISVDDLEEIFELNAENELPEEKEGEEDGETDGGCDFI